MSSPIQCVHNVCTSIKYTFVGVRCNKPQRVLFHKITIWTLQNKGSNKLTTTFVCSIPGHTSDWHRYIRQIPLHYNLEKKLENTLWCLLRTDPCLSPLRPQDKRTLASSCFRCIKTKISNSANQSTWAEGHFEISSKIGRAIPDQSLYWSRICCHQCWSSGNPT